MSIEYRRALRRFNDKRNKPLSRDTSKTPSAADVSTASKIEYSHFDRAKGNYVGIDATGSEVTFKNLKSPHNGGLSIGEEILFIEGFGS